MSSEIGNKALLRERAERLQILDRKIYPVNLATDVVQPVQEVDPQYMGPVIGAETYAIDSNTEDLSGLSLLNFEIIPATAADIQSRVNALHFAANIPSDAAPSEVQLFFYYEFAVGQAFRIVDLKPWFSTVNGSLTQVRYALGGSFVVVSGTNSGWHGYIPPTVPIRCSIVKSSGGTFPAGSELIWHWFKSNWPVGSLPPWG